MNNKTDRRYSWCWIIGCDYHSRYRWRRDRHVNKKHNYKSYETEKYLATKPWEKQNI